MFRRQKIVQMRQMQLIIIFIMGKTKLIKKIIDKKKTSAKKAVYKVEWSDGTSSWEKVEALIGIYDELVKFQLERDKKKKGQWVMATEPESKKVYKMINESNINTPLHQENESRGHKKSELNRFRDERRSLSRKKQKKYREKSENKMRRIKKNYKNPKQRDYLVMQSKANKISNQRTEEQPLYNQQKLRREKDRAFQIFLKPQHTTKSASISQFKEKIIEKQQQIEQIQEIDEDFIAYQGEQKEILREKFRKLLKEVELDEQEEYLKNKEGNTIIEDLGENSGLKQAEKGASQKIAPVIASYEIPQRICETLRQLLEFEGQFKPILKEIQPIHLKGKPRIQNQEQENGHFNENHEFKERNQIYNVSEKRINKIYNIAKISGQYLAYVKWEYLTQCQFQKKKYSWINRDIIRFLSPNCLLAYYEQLYQNASTWHSKKPKVQSINVQQTLCSNNVQPQPVVSKMCKDKQKTSLPQKDSPQQISPLLISIEQESSKGPTIAFN